MASLHTYTRAFKLPDGRWSVRHGFWLDERAASYKERGYPCVYVIDGVIRSITPTTVAVGRRVPALVLEVIDLLDRKGCPLASDHARWVRKVARIAVERGYGWSYVPFRKHARSKRKDRQYKDAVAWIGLDRFTTGSIESQTDFLAALHEIGHLVLGEYTPLPIVLQVEADAWYFAFRHAGEKISQRSYAEVLVCYRSYLRYYRRQNRRRASGRWPVPQEARHFVALYRDQELRPFRCKITDLANASTHKPFPHYYAAA